MVETPVHFKCKNMQIKRLCNSQELIKNFKQQNVFRMNTFAGVGVAQ